jgi:hypothetical protein
MTRGSVEPPRPRKKTSVGSRSFTRRRESERARAAQRRDAREGTGRALIIPSLDLGGALKRVPRVAWICALIAFLNATAWALIVPPFQGKDETDHFAYVMQLAENDSLPQGTEYTGLYPEQETLVMRALHYEQVRHSPATPTISSVREQQALNEVLAAHTSTKGIGQAGVASSEPPLYYAIQTIPYALASGNILDQLQLMRLVGALFGAMTALFAFLFLRELLPGTPWAATVGALCIALQPAFAFMSGSVNPDSMLYTVTAAVFLCFARAFRRGLTRRLAIVLGALVAVGFLTKLNFVGFAAGVYVGLILLAVRGIRAEGRKGLLSPAIAAGIGVSPAILYVLRNLTSGRPTLGILGGVNKLLSTSSLFHELSYVWQLYLPRLPGMTHYFAGLSTTKDVWFDRSVGLYGWFDTMFPTWVDNVALIPAAIIVVLCGRELVLRRGALRERLPELVTYAAIVLGVLVMIGTSSYLSAVLGNEAPFGEPRYLLPMLPLLGAVIALAVRSGGRRWAPVIGAVMVVLFLGHDIFSQLQVISRYYG